MEEKKDVRWSLCYEDKYAIENENARTLYLNNEIDQGVIDDIVYFILRYNRQDVGKPKEDRKPIILYVNSCGGEVPSGFGLIDAILASETPVYTVNLAMCASMGLLIYLAGHKRYSMPHSEFLLHDGSTFVYDSAAKVKDRIDFESNQIGGIIKELVLSRTKIDKKTYEKRLRDEWWFLAPEGKQIGVVDCIIGEDCMLDDILGK